MKIQKINSQSRRDFWADMVCEHCGHVEKNVKSVMLPNTPNSLLYKIGLICPNTDKEISKIEHVSLESDNGNFYSYFYGYDSDNNIIFSIENCPVIIMYQ